MAITCLHTCCKHLLIWCIVCLYTCCVTSHNQCYNSDWYRAQLYKTNPRYIGDSGSGIISLFGGVGFTGKGFSTLKVDRWRMTPCRRSRVLWEVVVSTGGWKSWLRKTVRTNLAYVSDEWLCCFPEWGSVVLKNSYSLHVAYWYSWWKPRWRHSWSWLVGVMADVCCMSWQRMGGWESRVGNKLIKWRFYQKQKCMAQVSSSVIPELNSSLESSVKVESIQREAFLVGFCRED